MEASYHHRNLQQKWLTIAKQLRASEEQVEEKFKSLQDQHTQLAKQIEEMRKDKMKGVIQNLLKETQVHQGIPTLISKNPVALEDLGSLVQALSMFEGVAFIACHDQEKVQIAAFCSKKAQMAGFKANDLIQKVSPVLDARGGGRPDMAQAGGKKPSHTDEALKIIRGLLAGENS
jgi:alanyl-tRNA synthetase